VGNLYRYNAFTIALIGFAMQLNSTTNLELKQIYWFNRVVIVSVSVGGFPTGARGGKNLARVCQLFGVKGKPNKLHGV
jgi:hypothetical protein